MVKHIILWKLSDELSSEEKESVKAGIKAGLESLVGKVPGLIECKVNIMQPTYIKGHSVTSTMWFRVVGENTNAVYATRANYDSGWSYEVAPRGSFLAQESSVANFGSDVAMLGGYLCFNTSSDDKSKMPVFSSEGDATYGMCLLNGGIFYAKGKVGYTGDVGHTLDNSRLNGYDEFSDYYIHHLELLYFSSANLKGDFKGSFSIVNGYVYNGSRNDKYCPENRNAVIYSGGYLDSGITVIRICGYVRAGKDFVDT